MNASLTSAVRILKQVLKRIQLIYDLCFIFLFLLIFFLIEIYESIDLHVYIDPIRGFTKMYKNSIGIKGLAVVVQKLYWPMLFYESLTFGI